MSVSPIEIESAVITTNRRRERYHRPRATGRVLRTIGSLLVLCLSVTLVASCAVRRESVTSAPERLREDLESSSTRIDYPASNVAATGSLWSERATTSLVGDTRAARAGDLLTVLIVEDTRGSQEATTDLNKDAQLSLSASSLAGYEKRLTGKHPNFDPTNILSTASQKAFKGDGATKRETSVVTTMTARVLGVYPNGDLAILGNKDVEVNHERQVFTLVGIVRVEDIASGNVVPSDRIAELAIHLGGRGDINDAQREGWLSRLIQKVWPF